MSCSRCLLFIYFSKLDVTKARCEGFLGVVGGGKRKRMDGGDELDHSIFLSLCGSSGHLRCVTTRCSSLIPLNIHYRIVLLRI